MSCLACFDREQWGPFSQYYDFTPCFLNGVIFNVLNSYLIVIGGHKLYHLLFKNNQIPLINNIFKIDQFLILRLILIFFQIILRSSISFSSNNDIKHLEKVLEILSMVFVLLPLTFVDFKKSLHTSSVILLYWVGYIFFTLWRIINLSIRPHNNFPLVISILIFVNSSIVLFCQVVPKKINYSTTVGNRLKYQSIKENPLNNANLFSIVWFNWMSTLMKSGYKKYLTLDDLPNLPEGFDNKLVTDKLVANYENELKLKNENASLLKSILLSFGKNLLIAAGFKVLSDFLNFAQPQLLKTLIKFINDYNNAQEKPSILFGINIALGMFFVSVFQTTCINQYFFNTYSTGIKIKSSLIGAIYNKSLVLSPESRALKSTGDIVNLMSIDTQRIQDFAEFGQVIWSAPLQILLSLISLYKILKNSMWFGFSIMVLMVGINFSLVKFQKTLQRKQMVFKDSRIKVVSEILTNIKSLKLYNWEIPYVGKLNHWRNDKELNNLAKVSIFKAINMSMWNMIPFLVSCSTFYGFIRIYDAPLTTDIVFPALALFNLLGFPLNVIPNVITAAIDCGVSLKRLNDFLKLDELDPNAVNYKPKTTKMGEVVVDIDNCCFSWKKFNFANPNLKNLNFKANKGELSCIIGKVGSGKSSFVKSLLGDLYKISGSVTVHGKMAYVSQNAWIMNGSIKENILFGHKFDEFLYEKVLFACDLIVDLNNFVDGDSTQVGEKGISLSGGQKARLSLARAIYSGADLYLLDDPLAAVDEHVGKHLIDHVFGENGMLKHKCKVLVTNSIHFLSIADNITLLEDGRIVEQCSNLKLVKMNNDEMDEDRKNSKIYQLIEQFGKRKVNNEDDEEIENDQQEIEKVQLLDDSSSDDVQTFKGQEVLDDASIDNDLVADGASLRRASTSTIAEIVYDDERQKKTEDERKEHLERGNVKWDVYLTYAKACNPKYVVVFLILAVLNMSLNVAGNYWLKYWSEINSRAGYNPDVLKYLLVYASLGIAGSLTLMTQCIMLWNVCIIRGAKNLHNDLTNGVIRAPMSFFETTPIGRILNRFSNDINKVDETLGRVFQSFFQNIIKVFFTLLVICFSTWQFLIVIAPLSVLYCYYQQYYMMTSRELKRLESITRSPIFAHFQETLNGITTIRGFGQNNRFMKLNSMKIDNNLGAYHPTVNCNRWLATRLEFLGSVIIFSAAVLPIIFGLKYGKVSAGLIGLSVSYSLQITGSLNWTVRMTVEVETNIVSVERIKEYSNIKSEAPEVIESNRPSKGWPTEGKIEFKNYSTRYRKDLDLVLKKINIEIKPQEKVGIVGRTGAGKSSLTMAIYRIIEPAEGEILIDGLSTSSIGLSDLRKKLSIIPQDAQVFEGTIRDNLDPTNSFNDEDILKAIELSHLKPHIEKMIKEQNDNANSQVDKVNDILSVKIEENGGNLSVGQKQLMCLARALLIPTKILILDEATAAVDVETDKIVQETIREQFNDRTILTIAHRINTIMDSDRILVLEKGEVAEFDKPEILLKDKNSIFYSLAKRGGLVE